MIHKDKDPSPFLFVHGCVPVLWNINDTQKNLMLYFWMAEVADGWNFVSAVKIKDFADSITCKADESMVVLHFWCCDFD